MKRIKIIVFLLFLFFISLLFYKHSSYKKYKGDWIITKLIQDGVNVKKDLLNLNCGIDLNNGIISWPKFKDSNLLSDDNIQQVEILKNGENLKLISFGYDIFQDTFNLSCIKDECCVLIMESKSLYIEFIYNGNLNADGRSKSCPQANLILDTIGE